MSFEEIVEQLPQLSQDEKLKLMSLLSEELEDEALIPGVTYEILSPFEAYAEDADLQAIPSEFNGAEVWSPQVTDPDALAFLIHLEKVLRTEGLEAANKLITHEGEPSDAE